MLTASGYVFTGWKMTYYSTKNAELENKEKITYGGITYGYESQHSYPVNSADDEIGVYRNWMDKASTDPTKGKGDMLFILTAQWTPRFAAVFDTNAGSDAVTDAPYAAYGGRSDMRDAGDFNGGRDVFEMAAPSRRNYTFKGWSSDKKCKPEETDKILHYGSSTNPMVPKSGLTTAAYLETPLYDGEAAGGYFTGTYYAVWEPKGHYTLYYDKNFPGSENTPGYGQYLAPVDETGNTNPLGKMEIDEDTGRWYEYVFEEGMSGVMVDGYYPLTHTKLTATGYKFIGWDMYYYRKATGEPEGKRLSGPYRYRINNSGGFDKEYGIYNTWFSENDCVDREFVLYAVWEPQYKVFYHEGTTDAVSNMPADSDIVSKKHFGGANKVFPASAPKRDGYYFVGWSTRDDCDVDNHPEDLGDVLHRNFIGPHVPKTAFTSADIDLTQGGYLYTDLYAVWSVHETYTLYYNENDDSETYPGIEYLGVKAGTPMPDGWTTTVTHQQVEDFTGKYYPLTHAKLLAKGYKFTGWDMHYYRKAIGEPDGKRLSGPYRYRVNNSGGFNDSYGIPIGWFDQSDCVDREFFLDAHWEPQYKVVFHTGDSTTVESAVVPSKAFSGGSKVFKIASPPTKDGYYLVGWSTDPQYDFAANGIDATKGFIKGIKSVSVSKTAFTEPDYNDTDEGFLRADLYPVWSPQPVYYITYDANEDGLNNPPFVGQYTGCNDPAMVWEEVITQAELDTARAQNKGYPLHRGYLTADGYQFTGWQLHYIRESTDMPSGGFYSVDKPDKDFKIYAAWFNDVVDNEFLLTAVWKPQFAVKFLKGCDDTVDNMPDTYSPLKAEARFSGNPKTAVFAASVPKREGYYFAGWTTEENYDFSTQGLTGLLRRNFIGPAVPLNDFTHAEHSDSYGGFMAAYVYAVWSPTPVWNVAYDPNKEALTGGEYLSDTMPSAHLVDGQWVFTYTQSEMNALLASAEGDNNAKDYYPLKKGDLTAKGYAFTGWTLHWKDKSNADKTAQYPVSQYGQNAFRIRQSIIRDDTSDYQFLLTADWEPRYTVKFHSNTTDAVTNMPADSEALTASDFTGSGQTRVFTDHGSEGPVPVRAGYVFLGWSTTEGDNTAAARLARDSSGVTVPQSACTAAVEGSFQADLYAVWRSGVRLSYVVDGDTPAGASDLPAAADYSVGDTVTVAGPMSAPGYTFSGWSVKEAPEGFTLSGATFTMPSGDVVLQGRFSIKHYQVKYYRNADDTDETVLRTADFTIADVTEGHIPLDKTSPTQAQTPAHRAFLHWSATRDGGDVTAIPFVESQTEPFKVYAVWKPLYDLKYDLNGHPDATGKPADTTWLDEDFTAGNVVVDTASVPSLDGWRFLGWKLGSATGTPDYPYPWDAASKVLAKSAFAADNTATLYAQWVKESHVIYLDDDGTTELHNDLYDSGVTARKGYAPDGTAFADPSKANRVFTGWAIQSGITAAEIGSDGSFTVPENDVKFIATYAATYQVTYEAEMDGAPVTLDSTVYAPERFRKDENVTYKPVPPAETGYTFSGWRVKTPSSGVTSTAGGFTMPAAEVVVFGEYLPNPHNVVYYEQDKTTVVRTVPSHYNKDMVRGRDENGAVILAPQLPNQIFTGWALLSGLNETDIDSDGSFTMPNGDVAFYATYAATYQVTYQAAKDGAPVTLDSAVYKPERFRKDAEVTYKDDPPAIAGYEFSGWSVQTPAGVTATATGFVMPAADVTVYGEYTPVVSKVIYYDKDGAQYGAAQEYPYGASVRRGFDEHGSDIGTPAHGGYAFVSWEIMDNTLAASALDSDGRFTMPAHDVKFREVCRRLFRLRYDPNGGDAGSVPADDPFETACGESVTRPLDASVTPTKDGARFRHWSLTPDGGEVTSVTASYGDDGWPLEDGRFTVRVYAVWETPHKVSYEATDAEGHSLTLDEALYGEKPYFDGDTVTVAPPLTDGELTFVGWTVKTPSGVTLVQEAGGDTTFTMPAKDVVLEGHFAPAGQSPQEYEITYRSGLHEGDNGYTEALGESHSFSVTADENGVAHHRVLANDARELQYVREGYRFTGWKRTSAGSGGNGFPRRSLASVRSPRAYAGNGLLQGGDVIDLTGSIVLTAQWEQLSSPPDGDPEPHDEGKTPVPHTGESPVGIVLAFSAAALSMMTATGILCQNARKRRRTR